MNDFPAGIRVNKLDTYQSNGGRLNRTLVWSLSLPVLVYFALRSSIGLLDWGLGRVPPDVTAQRAQILQQCKYVRSPAGSPSDFHARNSSDRHVPGTNPLLLKNAKILTGARNGTEVIYGDVFLEKGLIKAVGYVPPDMLDQPDLHIEDVDGAWVSPGLVDLHSHIGVSSSPSLKGGKCPYDSV